MSKYWIRFKKLGFEGTSEELQAAAEKLKKLAVEAGFELAGEETDFEPQPAVKPDYASIEAVRDICEPWINQWGGDEWGDSMSALHSACHTSYGFSDEDCALFAQKLIENLISQHEWMIEEGYQYGFMEEDDLGRTRAEACDMREYWLDGGNIKSDHCKQVAAETIATLPSWLFEDTDRPSLF